MTSLRLLRAPGHARRARGFTLIELIVVMVLMGILFVVGSSMVGDTMRTSYLTTENHSSGSQARYAMERMAREIRQLQYGDLGYSFLTKTSTALAFTKEDLSTVSIVSCGTNLTLRYSSAVTCVACSDSAPCLTNQISAGSFAFAYLDQLGAATTTNEEIRFVQITMTVTNAKTGKAENLRTRIFLRNAQKNA